MVVGKEITELNLLLIEFLSYPGPDETGYYPLVEVVFMKMK